MSFVGYEKTLKNSLEIGANTFQYFSRNPRGSNVRPLDVNDINLCIKKMKEIGFIMPLTHAPYTINPCSKDESLREFAVRIMKEDIKTLEYFSEALYNIHPGNHVGQGEEKGIELVADTLNKVIFPEQKTMILLETMSGKGSEIGKNFEEIKKIISLVKYNEKIGVCLDTCHVYSAGYDIVNNLDKVILEFDRIIGLDRLKAIHLNDTKTDFNSRKDRHEKLGEGNIKIEAVKKIINHPKLKDLPFYLETPNELDGYAKEISLLKTFARK